MRLQLSPIRIGIGAMLFAVGVSMVIYVLYKNSKYSSLTRTFSSYTILNSSWVKYKENFINDDGRVVDDRESDITTSEGQSYAMLRAVWIDDKDSFDKTWKWTQENLKRKDDNLFGWRWGRRQDGNYDFLEDGGENSASDANSDIALALILADRRWVDWRYKEEAKKILEDMWKVEVRRTNDKNYLIAGNWADLPDELVLNPSYFSPYAWRIFAEVDTERDWNSLIDPAYEVLEKSGWEPLDRKKGVGLPPDWVVIKKDNGELAAAKEINLTTNYSFDALRVPWRIALDYHWNGEDRALQYLKDSFVFLGDYYKNNNMLAGWYSHDGEVLGDKENPSMYAAALGYFINADADAAKRIYEEKIIRLYANDQNSFNEDIPYYEQNWLWFGAALYNGFLEDFK